MSSSSEAIQGVLMIAEHIKELLDEAPARLQATILADVLASSVAGLPLADQTPMLAEFSACVTALVSERSWGECHGSA